MRCPACESENREAARECSACGGALERRCPACGATVTRSARFCAECGRALGEAATTTGRKRQITVLFADLDESTPLAHELELEDLQGVLRSFQELCSDEIERYGGRVVQHLGDGVLAYFGDPAAHEDDAARAIRAALGIVAGAQRVAARSSEFGASALTARAGIHTGLVVVGEIGSGAHRETLAVGETVNVASRVLGAAGANEVLVTGETYGLAGSGFEADALGERALRGVASAVPLYRVRGTWRGGDERRGAARSPFVGRERELRRLEERLAAAARGEPAGLAIAGDAGVGKSRLLSVLRERVEGSGGAWIEWRCSRFMEQTPFHPVTIALEQRTDDAEAQAVLARLQSNEAGEAGDSLDASATPEARRQETLAALAAWGIARGGAAPGVLALEDAQWADPSTLELLGLLAMRAPQARLLIVATHRPEFQPTWVTDAWETLTLGPLTRGEARALLDGILGARAQEEEEVRDALVARSDGVPLFLEEMARVLLDDASPLASRRLPTSLRSLLDSRLDSVSTVLVGTLQLASTLGREFRLATLATAASRSEPTLLAELRELEATGLVVPDPARAGAFAFKHVLVQEAVYESMLRDERARLHLQVANALEADPSLSADQPEVLAHHFTEAGRVEQALGYWKRAGQRATARGAYREAIGLFDRGLGLAARLPRSNDLLLTELAFVESKGTALLSTFGYSDARVEESFARAWSLCERLGSAVPLHVLYGLWAVHLCRSDRDQAEALLARMRERAGVGEPVAELTASGCAGLRAFLGGDFARCREEMDAGIRWFDSPGYQAFIEESGYEGSLYLFAYRMWASWILGDIDLATRQSEELSALARRARTPYGPCIARGFRINLFRDRGDTARVRSIAERQLAHAAKQRIFFWQGPAHCGRGWALAREGDVAAGIAEIRQGLMLMRAVGLTSTLPYHQSALVEALLAQGDAKAALESAREMLELCARSLDQFYEAELRRLEGEALFALGQEDEALHALESALALARTQHARSYELRAATSLARVGGARDVGLLAEALAQFRDGFDTADLRTARALLESQR